MKSTVYVALVFGIAQSFGQSGWYSHPSGTSRDLFAVSYSDTASGIIAGELILLQTTNGGASWIPSVGYGGLGVCMVTKDIVVVVGWTGAIRRTTDAGATWNDQISGTSNWLYGVSFADVNTGTAVGTYGTILHTTNGGSVWTKQSSGTNEGFYAVSCPNSMIGTVVGSSGTILRTTDAGTTWKSQSSGTSAWFSGVSFTDPQTGTAVGQGGTIVHTTNGGATWIDQSIAGAFDTFINVFFTDSLTGTAVGGGGIVYRTTNGGTTWTNQLSGTTNSLFGVYFRDANRGTIVGTGGKILTTTTGGATWVDPGVALKPGRFALHQNYPNPFNPGTTIKYELPKSSEIRLSVYDLLGREVSVLVNERIDAGVHEVSFDVSGLSSGVYFYRLTAGSYVQTRKLLLIR